MENHPAPTPARTYIAVFIALAILTATTVFLAQMHLPHTIAVIVAACIALAKVSLIVAFFMHMRHEGVNIYFFFFSAIFLVAALILAIIPDVGLRP